MDRATRSALVIGLVQRKSAVSGGRKGLCPRVHVDDVPALRRRSTSACSSGLKMMPPGPERSHPVDGAVGPAPHEREASAGAQHPGHLGDGARLVDPVPGRGR